MQFTSSDHGGGYCKEECSPREERPRAVSVFFNRSDYAFADIALSVRCLNAKAWEDRPIVLRQIESLGDKS